MTEMAEKRLNPNLIHYYTTPANTTNLNPFRKQVTIQILYLLLSSTLRFCFQVNPPHPASSFLRFYHRIRPYYIHRAPSSHTVQLPSYQHLTRKKRAKIPPGTHNISEHIGHSISVNARKKSCTKIKSPIHCFHRPHRLGVTDGT